MARRHRVEALAWNSLRRAGATVPDEVATPLREAGERIGRENLLATAESLRLANAFGEAGIPLLFLKGLALGHIAYGTVLLKAGWDIDVLVPRNAAVPAAEILAGLGYEMVIPKGPATPERVRAAHGRSKETVWRNRARRSHVELHTGLADHPMLLPGVGIESPRQEVTITPGVTLPTLARDELFAYLTVHGASSAWFRLKWLADLAALLAGAEPTEISRLYRRSQELGAGRAPAVALLLAASLFGTALDESLRREIGSRKINRWLVEAAWRSMAGRSVATELGEVRGGTLWIHLMQFGLHKGARYKIRELRHQIGALRTLPDTI
jgi:hypothetical protein